MGLLRLIAAPIRAIVRFPLFQLGIVVALIFLMQAASDNSLFGKIYDALDKLVDASLALCAQLFEIKSFTRSGLTVSFMIGYVYLACLLILYALRILIGGCVDFLGWSNAFGLRNAIARERGIAAYRAWVPFERIRPADVTQAQWEATYAWPAGDRPPYPPLPQRILHAVFSYIIVIAAAAILLQIFTPFPVVTWIAALATMLLHRA
jgi:hypothetical protein